MRAAVVPLLVGFLIGFVGSMLPLGPISVLVLHRALKGMRATALAIAVGGAIPEAGYAALALWGVGHLVLHYPWVRWVGPAMAAAVVVLVVRDLYRGRLHRAQPAPELQQPWHQFPSYPRLASCFLLGFTTTSANVTLILTWSAAVSFIHQLAGGRFRLEPLWLVPVGVFLGIIAWFASAVMLAGRWSAKYGSDSRSQPN